MVLPPPPPARPFLGRDVGAVAAGLERGAHELGVAGLVGLAPSAQRDETQDEVEPAGVLPATGAPAQRREPFADGALEGPGRVRRAAVALCAGPASPDERFVRGDPRAQLEPLGRYVLLDELEEGGPLGGSTEGAEHGRVQRVLHPAPAALAGPGERPLERGGLVGPDPFGHAVGDGSLVHQGREVMVRVMDDGVGPGLTHGPSDGRIEVRHDDVGCAREGAEERLPAIGVLGSGDLHQGGPGSPRGAVEGDEDRAGLDVADPCLDLVTVGGRVSGGPLDTREEGRAVEHDDPWPHGRVQRRDDRGGEGVEVVDREVRLSARLLGVGPPRPAPPTPEDRTAQLLARGAEAHALADPQEESGDLRMAEDEAAAGLDALVTTVLALTGRTGGARVGVSFGGLADRDRKAEGVASCARLRHAAIAGTAVGIAPLTVTVAVEPDPAIGMLGAGRADHRRVGPRACHGPMLPRHGAISHGTAGVVFPPRYNRVGSGGRIRTYDQSVRSRLFREAA